MRILVTGGCGFIGSNLVPVLLQAGHQVRVLDNYSVGTPTALTGWDVELVEGDVRDGHAVPRAVGGMDAVIHLAAQTSVIASQRKPRVDFDVNAGGTLNLLLASRDAGVRRFVFASSNAPLGKVEPPVDESRAPRPLAPYGASKLAGEGYCSAFHGSYGLPTVALRFANVYGPRSSHKESVVARFIKDTLERGEMTIFGDGQQTRDLIYIADLCLAVFCALEVEGTGQVYHIATGFETRILDLAHLVRGALGRPHAKINFAPARPGEIYRNFAQIGRAQEGLNWRPRIPVTSGVPQTCQWFLEQQDWES